MSKNKVLTVLLVLAVMITVHSIVKAANNTPGVNVSECKPVAATATVTAVGMNPEYSHVTFDIETTSVPATIGAVVTVTGSSLELLKAEDIIITAVPNTHGITVSNLTVSNLATKTAVTTSATAVTFEAIINVPYNTNAPVPEIQYALTASTSAIVNGGFKDTIAMVCVSYVYNVPPEPVFPRLKMKTVPITMGVTEKTAIDIKTTPRECSILASSTKPKVVKANYAFNKISLKARKTGKTRVRAIANYDGYDDFKNISVVVKKSPDSILLKDGGKAAKKTIHMNAEKTKKQTIKKTYRIVLPKNTASYGYSIKISGKKAIVKKATVTTSKKGEQKLIITINKKSRGNAKVIIVPNSNKKTKARIIISTQK